MAVKLAVVTGANSGIGLSLCERLLSEHGAGCLQLCLVCRSSERAAAARQQLLSLHPEACIDIVIGDFASIKSVKRAAAELCNRYAHIDFLYLNAGIMPNPKVDLSNAVRNFLSRDVFKKLGSGEGFLQYSDGTSADGLQLTFATNVFGHFVLVHELKGIMGGATPSIIVWTSSGAANKNSLQLQDIQHCNGEDPYGSSKHLTDLASVALNEKFNRENIYSFTVCPGLVMTSLTYTIFPQWLWTYLLVPVCKLLRYFVPTFTLDGKIAAEALVWLSLQDPRSLDTRMKYHSCASIIGTPYVHAEKLTVEEQDVTEAYSMLLALYTKRSSDGF